MRRILGPPSLARHGAFVPAQQGNLPRDVPEVGRIAVTKALACERRHTQPKIVMS
jgi:hypothetical protein